MSDDESADALDETIDIRYRTIFRHIYGTNFESMCEGFGNMFDIFGNDAELIESRVRTAILDTFGPTLEKAALADATWKAVEDTKSELRIQNEIAGFNRARIAPPPPHLLEQLDALSPGTSKRISDRVPDYRDQTSKFENSAIAQIQMFRQGGQAVGLTLLIFGLMLSLAFAVIGEPIMSATSLSIAGITYFTKIKIRALSRELRSRNLQMASKLLRYAARCQSNHEE